MVGWTIIFSKFWHEFTLEPRKLRSWTWIFPWDAEDYYLYPILSSIVPLSLSSQPCCSQLDEDNCWACWSAGFDTERGDPPIDFFYLYGRWSTLQPWVHRQLPSRRAVHRRHNQTHKLVLSLFLLGRAIAFDDCCGRCRKHGRLSHLTPSHRVNLLRSWWHCNFDRPSNWLLVSGPNNENGCDSQTWDGHLWLKMDVYRDVLMIRQMEYNG